MTSGSSSLLLENILRKLAGLLYRAGVLVGIMGFAWTVQAAQNTQLWTVRTADTLPPGQTSISSSYDQIHRSPGDLRIRTLETTIAVGITSRLEGAAAFQAYRSVSVGKPEQLSFGQQSLGFFGAQTPGSPPLPSELMPGSSRVPRLRVPFSSDGALTDSAGYYNLLPFAGLVPESGAAGLITISGKYKLISEDAGDPLGLSINSYLSVPIHKGIDFLMEHPVGTADLLFGFDGIMSRNFGESGRLVWNLGYRHISQPAHASVFRLSDQLPISFGIIWPLQERVQFMLESSAEIFIGPHTPVHMSGSRHPMDVTGGVRITVNPTMSISGGYRPRGFVVGFTYTTGLPRPN